MKKEIKLTVGKLLFIVLIMLGFNILSSSAATSYAINANNIGYTDNSNLGAGNVQAAIDGTCTKISNKLTNLKTEVKSEVLDKIYPKGSIYITTEIKNAKDVATTLGIGTWEKYASGKTLVSDNGSNYITNDTNKGSGGKTSVSTTLTVANLPSHTHTVTSTGTVSSTFTGTKSQTESAGSHTHNVYGAYTTTSNTAGDATVAGNGWIPLLSGQLYNRSQMIVEAGAHTHSYTPSGTVSSTFKGTSTTTSSTGSNTSFTTSTMQPYIVVYMYRRTA